MKKIMLLGFVKKSMMTFDLSYKLMGVIFLISSFLTEVQAKSISVDIKKDSIHSMEKIRLGGVKQAILITGKDTVNNPILLILHGGPGFSELKFFRSYNAELDSSFTVVNWDQRGTGLSYDRTLLKSTVNFQQLIKDGHELIEVLKRRFHKKKIYLAGHSWGSLVGINIAALYPEDIEAYIGIGQVVYTKKSEKLALAQVIKMATKDHNTKALSELKPLSKRYPSYGAKGISDLYLQRKWLLFYGGVAHGKRDYNSFIKGAIAKESKLYNDTLSAEGETLSMNHLWATLLQANLFKSLPKLKVPVYFLSGRFDYNTNYDLIYKYFQFISAPSKELIWFEHSAHLMPFEEPNRFNKVIREMLIKRNLSKN